MSKKRKIIKRLEAILMLRHCDSSTGNTRLKYLRELRGLDCNNLKREYGDYLAFVYDTNEIFIIP